VILVVGTAIGTLVPCQVGFVQSSDLRHTYCVTKLKLPACVGEGTLAGKCMNVRSSKALPAEESERIEKHFFWDG